MVTQNDINLHFLIKYHIQQQTVDILEKSCFAINRNYRNSINNKLTRVRLSLNNKLDEKSLKNE